VKTRATKITLSRELIVDNFAGGGGASEGIEMALGYSPDVAINHDAEAIAMHETNHPETAHYTADVWDVDPSEVCDGRFGSRKVGLAWFSPDCKHHSKAKGGKPLDSKLRGLAWVVVKWAQKVRPRVIILENVEEFQDWGPLNNAGRPIEERKGETFKKWWNDLKACGYEIEARELRACDYGAPTTRKRLFIIARCDGQPIVWPEPSHGPGRKPYRTAAEIVDWDQPILSIFATRDEAKAFAKKHDLDGTPQRPLAEKTLARVARGVDRYVLNAAKPWIAPTRGFIAPTAHGGVGRKDHRVHSLDEPLRTVTGGSRGDHALVIPSLIQTGYGERKSTKRAPKAQEPRILDIHAPLGTVVAGGQKHGLVAAFLSKHNGGHEPTGTQLHNPMDTVTARDSHALTTAFLSKYYGTSTGSSMNEPVATITAEGNHLALVRAFLKKFRGSAKNTIKIGGDVYAIVDIGMRMLQPRELFRAQSFGDHYRIEHDAYGTPLTKGAQIKMAGNSVPPEMACALVRANYSSRSERRAA